MKLTIVNLKLLKTTHSKVMDVLDHNYLIEQYVRICNTAMLENKNRFPFKQILGAAKLSEAGLPIEVNVLGAATTSDYIFLMSRQGLDVKSHEECANCDCIRSWNVKETYLKDVVRHSVSYIENPAKLDWDWLYDA